MEAHHKIRAAAEILLLLAKPVAMEKPSLNRKRQTQQQAADKIKNAADKRKIKPLPINGMVEKKVIFHD